MILIKCLYIYFQYPLQYIICSYFDTRVTFIIQSISSGYDSVFIWFIFLRSMATAKYCIHNTFVSFGLSTFLVGGLYHDLLICISLLSFLCLLEEAIFIYLILRGSTSLSCCWILELHEVLCTSTSIMALLSLSNTG